VGNYKTKQTLGCILIGLGVLLVLMFLPFWIWSLIMGAVLIVVGILILKAC